MTEKKLVITLPDENMPGYLRRKIAGDKFSRAIREQREGGKPLPPDFYENLITFLLGFVSEPEDRDEARELLLDAPEKDYADLLEVINRASNPTTPEPTEKG